MINRAKSRMSFRVIVFIILAFFYALNIRVFVKPAGLLPGGIAGVTLLIQQIVYKLFNFEPSYTLINVALNIIPIYIGFKYIGKNFTMLSCIIIVLSSVFVDMIPGIPHWTDQMLLYCIFGGIINGFIVSLCLGLGGTTGGTDFISIYYSEQKGKDAWNYILLFNIIVLLISGIMFGFEKALFSIIFQYVSTQVIKSLYTKYQKSTLLIVTDNAEKVYKEINQISGHGATLFKGKGTYLGREVDMVYSVISTEEVDNVVRNIKLIDEKAFINVLKTDFLNGKFYNRPND